MEEKEDMSLLNSLKNGGVSIPGNISTIRDLNPATLVSICAQCLNLLDETASPFPSSFPDSLADKFKICTDIALAIKKLGYLGDMTYNKFLYPSEDDLYKLVGFLVERLSESSNGVKFSDLNGEKFVTNSTEKLKDLSLHEVESNLSGSNIEDLSFSKSGALYLDGKKLTGITTENPLADDEGDSGADTFGSKENLAGKDDERIQNLTSPEDQSSKVRHVTEILQNQEKVLIQEVTARTSEIQSLEEELQLLQAAAEMVFVDQHHIDFHMEQLNEQLDSRRHKILELESQWEAFRKPLEEKKISLEETLYTNIPKAQEKLQKLKEVELEKQSILSEIRRREEERSQLSVDLAKQSGLPSRTSYIERIKEITKNSRKQDTDIERILKETRELQLESNSIQDRLHRTYTVLDEIVFREAKKEPVARQAYRLLTSIHECFEQISEKILMTDRIRREMAEHERKLSAMANRSFNVDKLQADLDTIRKENENLEQQLEDN